MRGVPAGQRGLRRGAGRESRSWRSASIEELGGLVEQGLAIGPQTVDALGGVLDSGASGADVLHDVVWRHRGKKIAPKTLTQKRYVDAIRGRRSRSASARPAPARPISRWRWRSPRSSTARSSRIILTRPAVEAGERLGFLPGDMQEKVDPYLRPLYDALYDMLDAERVDALHRARA